jgi:hypothetical protein
VSPYVLPSGTIVMLDDQDTHGDDRVILRVGDKVVVVVKLSLHSLPCSDRVH